MTHPTGILGGLSSYRLRKSLRMFLAAAVVAVAGATAQAAPHIADISNVIQYDATHYYAYVMFNAGVNWDTANTLASTEPGYYNGQPSRLATFTDAQYTWFVGQEGNFTSPVVDTWDIAWIGARNVGADTYTWLNGQGTISGSSPHWSSGEPISGNYGVNWQLSGYGDVWATAWTGYSGYANAIVEYAPASVPEPGTVGLALAGLLGVVALRRRLVRY